VRAFPEPDTGTTRGDLLALMRATLGMYRDPATAALLSGLIAAMVRSAPIAHAVRSGFLATRRQSFRRVFERGVRRGDLPRRVDIQLATDLLSGPLFYRALFTGAPLDERLTRTVVDVVLRGLSPPVTVPARPARKTPVSRRSPR
jgi:AcrR family transcriptional regulator